MTAIQQWGRKESLIWPPRGFYYTYGAIFLAIVATGLLAYVHYRFALSPMEQYYLPYYLRTETARYMHPTSPYQFVYITDGKSRSRIALDADVQPGETPQFSGNALPFAISKQATVAGFRYIMRGPTRPYQNKALQAWIAHWIYADVAISSLFATPFYWGIVVLAFELPFSIRKDIQRRKELRYGRRLKGPILVNPRQFTNGVAGNGIGITTNDDKRPLRIPRNAENSTSWWSVTPDRASRASSGRCSFKWQIEETAPLSTTQRANL